MDNAVQLKREERRRFMLEGNLLKVIPVVALPQVVTMLIDSLYNLADTYFVSQIGEAATSAVGINDSLMMIIRAISLAFGMGASSYISRMLGAKEDEKASQAASTTLITAMAFVGVLAVIALFFLDGLVTLLGATESARPYSMDYAKYILITSPFTAATVCLSQTLRAEGSTTYSMIGSVSGCILNCFLDPLFINVLELEVAGAAIATGISKIVSFIILMFPYWRKKCVLEMRFKYFVPKKSLYSEIARMGIPTFLRTSMMSVGSIITNNVAGNFGDMALSAVSIANKVMRFVSSAVMGFGQGFQPIGGFCWGAKKFARFKKAFYITIAIGCVLSIVFGGILFALAGPAMDIFSAKGEAKDIGIVLIRSQCIVLSLHMCVMIATGLFQASGKAFGAGFLGLSRNVISLIPCVLILSKLYGVDGLSVAQAVADVISFILAVILVVPVIKELNKLHREVEVPNASAAEAE